MASRKKADILRSGWRLKVNYLTVDPLHLPHLLLLHLLEWLALKEHKLPCEHFEVLSILKRVWLLSRTSAHFSIMITKNLPSVGDMEEGTYMEKAMWTWRETTGSAKLTFGFNFIVLFTAFQLFLPNDKTYIPSIQGSRSIVFRYFLLVKLDSSEEQESWTRSEDHQAGLGQVGGQQSLISCVTSPRSTFQEPKRWECGLFGG